MNTMAVNGHRSHCKYNTESKRTPRSAWNKGLTKETSDRVAQGGKTLSRRILSGEIIPWVAGRTKENDPEIANRGAKIKETLNKKVLEGTWHNSFSRSRIQEYRGFRFYGGWEVAYAKYLDSLTLPWSQPKEVFPYTLEGRVRGYTPDFYLQQEDLFVEVKGWPVAKDFAKWESFPNNFLVVFGRHLKDLDLISDYKSVDESKMVVLGFTDSPRGWVRNAASKLS